jgi:peptide deformylase
VLREHASPVVSFDAELASLADRMTRIMHAAPGVGLAATQLGVLKRVLVYEVVEESTRVLVNPDIVERSTETEIRDEGCLSVSDVTVPVERALNVRVRAQNLSGEVQEYSAEGLEARVIQHELDHLDGMLILGRTSRSERARSLRELRQAEELG